LPGERDDRTALDPAGLEPDPGVADLGGADEVVQRHAVGQRQRKEQFQRRPPLARLQPGQGALRDAGGLRQADQGHPALGAEPFEAGPDLVERGGDRGGWVVHPAHLTRISRKRQRSLARGAVGSSLVT
jgi:hypothetical protein